MTKERAKELFKAYVLNDLECADTDYVREVLTDVCGLTKDEIAEFEFEWLFNNK